jgi:iron complex outermembrane receptor protein
MRICKLSAAAAMLAVPAMAAAETAADAPSNDNVFGLGQITVTGRRPQGVRIGESTLASEAIYAFNRNSLDDAATLIPGVTAGNSGGTRNERLLFVRGFDRFQVPVSIDGIRVYLPADNRLDYGRFLTPDIAEIQVAKGYASVLDGPGAMGGAINLVTRKPTKEIEAEARGTLTLDRDLDYAGYNVFALLGTRQDKFYVQGSFARNVTDHWDLPHGYSPTPDSAEDGGARDFSATRDWRVNLKAGFTPNDSDEYSISYTRQEGRKNAPLHVTNDITQPLVPGTPAPRFWTWPYWNIESIYFLSTTAISDAVTLKTRIYRNTFDNLLRSFNDRTQTTQSAGYSFNSYYADKAYGGSAELAIAFSDADTLTLAAHYRRDKHVEWQQGFPSGAVEPNQHNVEDTSSVAAENRFDISPQLTLTLGASYDWRNLKKAEEYGAPPGAPTGTPSTIYSYPLRDSHAFNWQGRLDWQAGEATRLHISVSRRTRFPTIFERFSTQFGSAASNPGLDPERATNFEIGGTHDFGKASIEGAVFYSRVDDAIVAVRPLGFPAGILQRQNLGDGDYYGGEIALNAQIDPSLSVGINYSYIHRSFDIKGAAPGTMVPVFELTDVPAHKGFVYANWEPVKGLRIVPNVEFASKRMTLASTTPTPPGIPFYYKTGSYVQANLRVDYEVLKGVEIGVGARNIFDRYYVLTDGFPEPGRSFFVSARARY